MVQIQAKYEIASNLATKTKVSPKSKPIALPMSPRPSSPCPPAPAPHPHRVAGAPLLAGEPRNRDDGLAVDDLEQQDDQRLLLHHHELVDSRYKLDV